MELLVSHKTGFRKRSEFILQCISEHMNQERFADQIASKVVETLSSKEMVRCAEKPPSKKAGGQRGRPAYKRLEWVWSDTENPIITKQPKGTSLKIPENEPIKKGFLFECWLLNGNPITNDIVVESDLILQAIWKKSPEKKTESEQTREMMKPKAGNIDNDILQSMMSLCGE